MRVDTTSKLAPLRLQICVFNISSSQIALQLPRQEAQHQKLSEIFGEIMDEPGENPISGGKSMKIHENPIPSTGKGIKNSW